MVLNFFQFLAGRNKTETKACDVILAVFALCFVIVRANEFLFAPLYLSFTCEIKSIGF